jgi:hypothetical protein
MKISILLDRKVRSLRLNIIMIRPDRIPVKEEMSESSIGRVADLAVAYGV